jgi:hypothetical protein
MSPDRLKLLALVAAILAAFGGYELLMAFHDWNRLQGCVTAGRRACR